MKEVKQVIIVEGMNCAHCKMRVENTLGELKGVKNVAVDLESGEVEITAKNPIKEATLEQSIADIGYQVVKHVR